MDIIEPCISVALKLEDSQHEFTVKAMMLTYESSESVDRVLDTPVSTLFLNIRVAALPRKLSQFFSDRLHHIFASSWVVRTNVCILEQLAVSCSCCLVEV